MLATAAAKATTIGVTLQDTGMRQNITIVIDCFEKVATEARPIFKILPHGSLVSISGLATVPRELNIYNLHQYWCFAIRGRLNWCAVHRRAVNLLVSK